MKKDEQTAAGSSVSVEKAHGEKKSLIDKLAKKEGSSSQVVPASNNYLPNQEQAAYFNQMTQNEMSDYREEIADRAIIAAVKSI